MANIHIRDIASTELQELDLLELQELDLLAYSENYLQDLSDQEEVNNYGGGYPVGMTSGGYLLD
jgi:hypothetical protein